MDKKSSGFGSKFLSLFRSRSQPAASDVDVEAGADNKVCSEEDSPEKEEKNGSVPAETDAKTETENETEKGEKDEEEREGEAEAKEATSCFAGFCFSGKKQDVIKTDDDKTDAEDKKEDNAANNVDESVEKEVTRTKICFTNVITRTKKLKRSPNNKSF